MLKPREARKTSRRGGFGTLPSTQEALGDILSEKERKEAIIQFFGITKDELEAVGEEKIEKLVLERVALLDVKK